MREKQSIIRKWLSGYEAAEYLGASYNFLAKDRINRLHNIPYAKLGRHIRYNVDDLDKWLESTKKINGSDNNGN